MGGLVNRPITKILGWAIAALVIALNVFLVVESF